MLSQLLADIECKARQEFVPVIRGESAKILAKSIAATKPKRILEIGTAVGFSGILMLSQTSQCHLDTIEIREDRVEEAKENFTKAGFLNRVTIFLGDAGETLDSLEYDGYDFVFMDGAKSRYKDYLPKVHKLLKTGGIIFTDNIYFQGYVTSESPTPKKHKTIVANLRIYIEMLNDKKKFDTTFIDIEDGIAVTKKL